MWKSRRKAVKKLRLQHRAIAALLDGLDVTNEAAVQGFEFLTDPFWDALEHQIELDHTRAFQLFEELRQSSDPYDRRLAANILCTLTGALSKRGEPPRPEAEVERWQELQNDSVGHVRREVNEIIRELVRFLDALREEGRDGLLPLIVSLKSLAT